MTLGETGLEEGRVPISGTERLTVGSGQMVTKGHLFDGSAPGSRDTGRYLPRTENRHHAARGVRAGESSEWSLKHGPRKHWGKIVVCLGRGVAGPEEE